MRIKTGSFMKREVFKFSFFARCVIAKIGNSDYSKSNEFTLDVKHRHARQPAMKFLASG